MFIWRVPDIAHSAEMAFFRPVLDFTNQKVCDYAVQNGLALIPCYECMDRSSCTCCVEKTPSISTVSQNTLYIILYTGETMTEISVFVASRGGNTQKVADAIAEELGVMVGDIKGSLPNDSSTIFLGSGVYGGKPGSAVTEFIGRGEFTGRKVALFATSGGAEGAKNTISMMADAVKERGGTVIGDFHCRGKFLLTNRGHPNEEDLVKAKKFAREMLGRS